MAYIDRTDQRAYGRQHYQDNKALYNQRARDWRKQRSEEMVTWINDLKASVRCADCDGKFHFSAMDFDHLRDKDMNVAILIRRGTSWKRVFAEIMKCEIVCSNCHRVRTWQRVQT